MGVRSAIESDVPAMASMAAIKRKQYEQWQPVFHRIALDAENKHAAFLKDQLGKEKNGALLLVHETNDKIDAFLYLRLVGAPPVYEPGGKVAAIDDYVVAEESAWLTIGKSLLVEAMHWAKANGAVLANVVCGPKDTAKREVLKGLGLEVASEWQVKAL